MTPDQDQQPPSDGTGPAGGASQAKPFIVVGVDGSDRSSGALRWAAHESRLRGAALHVVHAWQMPALSYAAYVPANAYDGSEVAASSLDAQLGAVLGNPTDMVVVPKVTEGPAAQAILEAAKGAELVVVGSRGLGGFRGLLLGSVSTQVAHHATCPVVIVHK